MEKILVIINPHTPQVHTIDFACQMAKTARAKLTGVFVENSYLELSEVTTADSIPYFSSATTTGAKEAVRMDPDQAIRWFTEECDKRGVGYNIYRDNGEPLQEIVFESRYADLIITDPAIHYYDEKGNIPSGFVKQLLLHAECPVLLAPEHCDYIDEIIFCYDGSASASFATRQFTYVLPQFRDCKVTVMEVSKHEKPEFTDGHRRLMDWLKMHYKTVTYQSVKGNSSDELLSHLFMHKDKMVVIGAFGRSMLSRLFRGSSAEKLIRAVDLPIFITHH